MDNTEILVAVYARGRCWSFRKGGAAAASVYGGPLDGRVTGQAYGPARLHHVASLSHMSLPFMGELPHLVFSLPLVYGFRFDGCALEYQFKPSEIELVRLVPAESTEDWPYPDYPPLLPYIPIEASAPVAQSWEAFASQFGLGDEVPPAELVAVVPPAFLTGHSLWGRSGDLEGATVVFECDLGRSLVRSYNVCG